MNKRRGQAQETGLAAVQSLVKDGDGLLRKCNWLRARRSYQEALSLATDLKQRDPIITEHVYAYWLCLIRLGDWHARRGEVQPAISWYRKARRMSPNLAIRDPNTPCCVQAESEIATRLGDLHAAFGKPMAAVRCYQEAYDAARSRIGYARREWPAFLIYSLDMVACGRKLGDAHFRLGDYRTALWFFNKAQGGIEDLGARSGGHHEVAHESAILHRQLGDLFLDSHEPERAMELYCKGLVVGRRLILADSHHEACLSNLGETLLRIGRLRFVRQEFTEAHAALHEALGIATQLLRKAPGEVAYALLVAAINLALASCVEHDGQAERSENYYRKAFQACQSARQSAPGHVPAAIQMAMGYCQMGQWHQRAERTAQARRHYQMGVGLIEALLRRRIPWLDISLLATDLHCGMAKAYLGAGDNALTRSHARKAAAFGMTAYQRAPDSENALWCNIRSDHLMTSFRARQSAEDNRSNDP